MQPDARRDTLKRLLRETTVRRQADLVRLLRREGFEIAEVSTHVRRVRLTYLASRFDAYSPTVGHAINSVLEKVGLAERTVGVSFGDIFTVIARKPDPA